MKKSTLKFSVMLIIALAYQLIITSAIAQVPEKISYQAVIRNGSGNLVQNGTVGIRIQILQNSEFGAAVYVETHTATTNINGLVTLKIGSGSVVLGDFDTINWANGPYFLKTETDPTGGVNYTISGNSQLLSVPYALYAKKSENSFSGDYNDLTNKPTILDKDSTNEIQQISISSDSLFLSKGGGKVIMAGNIKGYSNITQAGYGSGLIFSALDSVTFTLSVPHTVYINADVQNWGYPGTTECYGAIKLNFDGADDDKTLNLSENRPTSQGSNSMNTIITSYMKKFSAGTHKIKLLKANNTGCGGFNNVHLNVLVLGN